MSQLIAHEECSAVLGAYFTVYNTLGAGFLESVYQRALAIELANRKLDFIEQAPLTVSYQGQAVGEFRADFLVNQRVVVEVKAVTDLAPAHEVQLVNYLRATNMPVGLLLNFGARAEFRRRVLTSSRNQPSSKAALDP